MSRYTDLLEGSHLSDVALSEGGYNYYGYTRPDDSWIIMRENTAETEYRFKIGGSDYDFSDRATGGYKRADQFND